jgi:hypothetical protein
MVIVAASAVACSSADSVPVTNQYTVSSANAWAGSTVTVVSAGLRAHTDTGSIFLGTYVLPVHRENDSTASVTLPDTISGSFAPILRLGAWTQPLDSITVYGYADVATYPFASDWDTYASPRSAAHAMIMTSGDDDTLRFVDLDTHQFTSLGGELLHGGSGVGLWGPGPSYDGSFYLEQGQAAAIVAPWQLAPVPAQIPAGLARLAPLTEAQNVMRLGASTWFASQKTGAWIVSLADTAATTFAGASFAPVSGVGGPMNGLVISPRGDRAAILPVSAPGGVPVLTMPEGNVAFRISNLQTNATDADFSADGSLLAMAGDAGDLHRVIVVNATTGATVHDTTIAYPVESVRFSPDKARLYVESPVADSSSSPVAWYPRVLVLNAATFGVLGQLTAPHSSSATLCHAGGCFVRIALNTTGSLYFFDGTVLTNQATSHAWRFTVAPQSADAQAVVRPRSGAIAGSQ